MRRWALALLLAACAGQKKHEPPVTFSAGSFGPAWDDPARCAAVVRDGHLLDKSPDRFRVVTWNLHWFPNGRAGDRPSKGSGTDIAWLACAIAFMQADVVAVQEVQLTEQARAARTELTDELERLTGSSWGWEQDGCADPFRQHLALLYRTDRALVSHPLTDATLDPSEPRRKEHDTLCPGSLRPALGVYVKSKAGGVDFHLLTVHLDSGTEEHDYDNRKATWARIERVVAQRQALVSDDDVVFAGDFSTMGCPSCGVTDANAERQVLAETCRSYSPSLVLTETTAQCSEFYQGHGMLVDQVVTSRAMREAYGAVQRVEGPCGRGRCEPLDPAGQQAFVHLSDHCPVYVDLLDQDADDGAVSRAP